MSLNLPHCSIPISFFVFSFLTLFDCVLPAPQIALTHRIDRPSNQSMTKRPIQFDERWSSVINGGWMMTRLMSNRWNITTWSCIRITVTKWRPEATAFPRFVGAWQYELSSFLRIAFCFLPECRIRRCGMFMEQQTRVQHTEKPGH